MTNLKADDVINMIDVVCDYLTENMYYLSKNSYVKCQSGLLEVKYHVAKSIGSYEDAEEKEN